MDNYETILIPRGWSLPTSVHLNGIIQYQSWKTHYTCKLKAHHKHTDTNLERPLVLICMFLHFCTTVSCMWHQWFIHAFNPVTHMLIIRRRTTAQNATDSSEGNRLPFSPEELFTRKWAFLLKFSGATLERYHFCGSSRGSSSKQAKVNIMN